MPLDITELERRIKRSAAARRVFDCPDGVFVLNEIKAFCNGDSFIYDPNHHDPVTLAVRVGKRDALQFIMNLLKDDPEKAREKLDAEGATTRKTE